MSTCGRCGSRTVAEDLTAETFLAAVTAVQRGAVGEVTVGWLIGIARHKLVDHWRRTEREQRRVDELGSVTEDRTDPWDAVLDRAVAARTLDQLAAPHRAALTLRYLDALPVAEVAAYLDRSVAATESLLTRAKAAFRHRYEGSGT